MGELLAIPHEAAILVIDPVTTVITILFFGIMHIGEHMKQKRDQEHAEALAGGGGDHSHSAHG